MAQGSDWYYSQHEPETERNNKFVGFLILVAFILACIFSLTFLAEHYGSKSNKHSFLHKSELSQFFHQNLIKINHC
jgi:hypothetical protein